MRTPLIAILLCAVACDAPEAASPDASVDSALTTHFDEGIWARSELLPGRDDVETVLMRDEVILAQSWLLADEGVWDFTIVTQEGPAAGKGMVEREYGVQTPSMASMNQRLYDRWETLSAPYANASFVDFDDPGCDVVDARGALIAGDNHCMQQCCTNHDKCYSDSGCSAASWVFGDDVSVADRLACQWCNIDVVRCLGECARIDPLRGVKDFLFGDHKCPEGQHQCFDVECDKNQLYCRSDCYRDPSPCEVIEQIYEGEHWCSSECRNQDGRKGYNIPDGAACNNGSVIDNCDCPVTSAVDGFHGRCKDSQCEAGRLGFCADGDECGSGAVFGSPCCGQPGQPCCFDEVGDEPGGACVFDDQHEVRCFGGIAEHPGVCQSCGRDGERPCFVLNGAKFDEAGCDSGFIFDGLCHADCGHSFEPCCPGDFCFDPQRSCMPLDGKKLCLTPDEAEPPPDPVHDMSISLACAFGTAEAFVRNEGEIRASVTADIACLDKVDGGVVLHTSDATFTLDPGEQRSLRFAYGIICPLGRDGFFHVAANIRTPDDNSSNDHAPNEGWTQILQCL